MVTADDPPATDPDALYQAAVSRHRAGDLEAARVLYAELLALAPDHAEGRHLAGMLAYQQGDIGTALAQVEAALEQGHRTASAWSNYGVLLLASRQPDVAAAALRTAHGLAPGDAGIAFNLGLAERQAGRLEAAIAALSQAAAAQPERVDVQHALGLALQAAGQRGEALASYERALALDPGLTDAVLNRGVLQQEDGDLAAAEASYRAVLTRDPASVMARNNLGAVLRDQGRLDEAMALFREALALDPKAVDVLNNLGAALRLEGNSEAAAEAYRTALGHDPVNPVALANLSEVLRDLGRAGEALDAQHRAVKAAPDDPRAWRELGRALELADDLDGASAAFGEALARDPAPHKPYSADLHHLLGGVLRRRQLFAEAASHHARAAALAPRRSDLQVGLALALLKAGDAAGALAACDEALVLDRFDQEALAYKALALRLAGDDAAADRLTDIGRFLTVLRLPAPSGYASMPEFNAALAAELRAVRHRAFAPARQSIRGGTQTQNDLFAETTPAIQAFRALLDASVAAYLAGRESDPESAFLAARPQRRFYKAWSVILREDGYHVPHIHPDGCIAGVYYVEIPEFAGEAGAGHLEFGRPGIVVKLPKPPPLATVEPVPGRLVLFPSYFWHGTRPFRNRGERITIAFDIRRPGR